MRTIPKLFKPEMVRAILDGRKTVTRRPVKDPVEFLGGANDDRDDPLLWGYEDPDGNFALLSNHRHASNCYPIRCPHGAPGDLLMVRERMRVIGRGPLTRRADTIRVRYEADGAESGLLPYPERLKADPQIGKCLAYGGYREAWRIALRVTSVRVERVQDITESEALREGVAPRDGDGGRGYAPATGVFAELWDSMYSGGPYEWQRNPWTWAVDFERVETPQEAA